MTPREAIAFLTTQSVEAIKETHDARSKINNALVDVADMWSGGAISSLIEEFAPDADADVRAAITSQVKSIQQKLNEGYDKEQVLNMYSTPAHSATYQAINKQKADIIKERSMLEEQAQAAGSKSWDTFRTSEKLRTALGQK